MSGELERKMSEWDTLQYAASLQDKKPTLHHRTFDEDKQNIGFLGDTHIGSRYFNEDELQIQAIEYLRKKDADLFSNYSNSKSSIPIISSS